jgi:predicted HTH domain antitoxin
MNKLFNDEFIQELAVTLIKKYGQQEIQSQFGDKVLFELFQEGTVSSDRVSEHATQFYELQNKISSFLAQVENQESEDFRKLIN